MHLSVCKSMIICIFSFWIETSFLGLLVISIFLINSNQKAHQNSNLLFANNQPWVNKTDKSRQILPHPAIEPKIVYAASKYSHYDIICCIKDSVFLLRNLVLHPRWQYLCRYNN